MTDYIHVYEIYSSQKINCKKMIDGPKNLNGNQALLQFKGHILQLSYTSLRAHTGYLGYYVWQYGELSTDNTPVYELVNLFQRNK